MNTSPPTLSFASDGDGIKVDLDKLLVHKLAVQGNSGSGKSWMLRTLLEGTHGRVQHLVIDPEGEFSTLRELFDDYVILGDEEGDLAVGPATVAPTVAALAPAGANIILNLSSFGESERDALCAEAVGALMALPRHQWRHILAVVDEAQTLAPQMGSGGASLAALTDLALRGRKRGLGLVVATGRLALLDKNLLAMCSNRLIGLTTLGNDAKRAAEELGFNASERGALKKLSPGEWFAFGPAISQEVVRVRSAPVRSTHPEPGQVVPPQPPANERLRELLQNLRESEPVAGEPEAPVAKTDEADIKRRIDAAVARAVDEATGELNEQIARLEDALRETIEAAARGLGEAAGGAATEPVTAEWEDEPTTPEPTADNAPSLRASFGKRPLKSVGVSDERFLDLEPPKRRILEVLAGMEAVGVPTLDRRTAAVLSKQSPKSSAYGAHVAKLNALGLVTYTGGGRMALTDEGRRVSPPRPKPATPAELHRRWLEYLSTYEADLLKELIGAYPDALSRDELAKRAGRSVDSSAFGAAVSGLKKLGLAEYPQGGQVVASELLWEVT